MSTFTLYVRTDGAAFEPVEPELVRILRETADLIESRGAPYLFTTIFDHNGNDVGRFALKDAP